MSLKTLKLIIIPLLFRYDNTTGHGVGEIAEK